VDLGPIICPVWVATESCGLSGEVNRVPRLTPHLKFPSKIFFYLSLAPCSPDSLFPVTNPPRQRLSRFTMDIIPRSSQGLFRKEVSRRCRTLPPILYSDVPYVFELQPPLRLNVTLGQGRARALVRPHFWLSPSRLCLPTRWSYRPPRPITFDALKGRCPHSDLHVLSPPPL